MSASPETKGRWFCSCLFVGLLFSREVLSSELYFSPEMIDKDVLNVADLSRFSSGSQLPGEYQVDIYVNGNKAATRDIKFIDANKNGEPLGEKRKKEIGVKDNTGLMACLTQKDLEDVGVDIKKTLAFNASINNQCVPLGKDIPNAFTFFDFQKMRLDISVPQASMQNKARGYISPDRWDEGINAALLNYNFNGNSSTGSYGSTSSHYLNLNSGLNVGPWRLRDYRTWNEYDSKYYSYQHWEHIKTYAERAIIPLRSELIIGDDTTSGDVFDSLGFRGIQMSTDDSMYPDSLRGFAPVIRGMASTNAKVTIKQNGYTVYQTFVSPGAFAIKDLYPVYLSGDLEVTVTEADGSVRSFTVPYSSVPILQREGHIKYSFAAGRYVASGDSYRKPKFVQGTLIWGAPRNITAYGGMQYSENYWSALLGAGLNLGELGAVSLDVTHAKSTLADGNTSTGQSLRFLYARALNSLGTTVQLTGYRYSTRGFHTLDETALKGMRGWQYDFNNEGGKPGYIYSNYYDLYNSKKETIQASISQELKGLGSLYFSGVRKTYWNTSDVDDSLQVGLNGSIGDINYGLTYDYSRQTGQHNSERSIYLSLSVPLNTLFSSDGEKQHSVFATYNASRSQDGKITHQAGLSGSALEDNNLYWNVSQGYSHEEGNNGSVNADYTGTYGKGNLGYSYSDSYRQYSYGISGSMLLHREGLTLGQPIGETSVLVSVPGINDVKIKDEIGVRTDGRGYAIKPYASVYRENRISLDADLLDEHVDIDNTITSVIPTKGAIVKASFKGHAGSRVLMTLTYNNKPLPFGTIVTAGDRGGIVSDNGLVYLSGLTTEGSVNAKWGDGADKQCSFKYRLPAESAKENIIRINGICR